ncbi:FecR domain-containing protein [Parapedobacter sp. 10938]|uniref:FecR domain-containing protein n=1 Tax=Parapedobacter flavus TaxID=3110225 RepID=UPI002DBEA62E|nr:FecR domain-containing protein [Parapedobacter sp. 10938]MEC3881111.1 FecR domain-containing protein [Parapedobacter sp. 10938]
MDDALLMKYLLNEATEEEAKAVRRWVAAHPDNKRHYTRMELIWEISKSVGPESGIDEQEAWERFTARLDGADHAAAPSSAKTLIRRMGWTRIVAVLVIALFTAFAGYYFVGVRITGDRLMGAVHETTNLVDTDTLADGSVITLSKFASLRFSQGLFQQKRAVELRKGSVFFEVAHDQDKPFVIQSGKVTVTVLGTSFHVSRNGDETTVIVESGKVKVTGLDKTVELEARQKVTINTNTRQFEERTVIGVLDHTPLWRIAEMLEDAYGVEVTIGNETIRDLPMTTTLHQGTLDETLRVITETLGVTATRRGNQYVFN